LKAALAERSASWMLLTLPSLMIAKATTAFKRLFVLDGRKQRFI
jgi:hypothetical protein